MSNKKKGSSFSAVLEQAKRVKEGKPVKEVAPEWANITIRVTKDDRAHWQSCAKKEGVTITELITGFLSERYGTADD